MEFSAESLHLTNVMNANGFSLRLINLLREKMSYSRNIGKVMENQEVHLSLIAGSFSEGLMVVLPDFKPSDIDVIVLGTGFKVHENISEQGNLEASYPLQGYLLRVPDNANPGYSKLAVSQITQDFKPYCYNQGSKEFLKNTMKEKMFEFKKRFGVNFTGIHGPAVNVDYIPRSFFEINERFRGLSPDFSVSEFEMKLQMLQNDDHDYVLCLEGEKWPDEASEWQVRERKSEWPTKELLDKIINSGYFLAAVGSKESNERDIQWRLSFNKAELLLIESFNETQIHCIMFLKLLKIIRISKVAGKNITSYSLKTLMFWCMEEKSEDFWQSSNLVNCICFCIAKLKSFVEKMFLPNYFISKRNQFNSNEFTQEEQIKTKQCLEYFLKKPKRLLQVHEMYKKTTFSTVNIICQQRFVSQWLGIRISMALEFHGNNVHKFLNFYREHSIANIYKRLKEAKTKLEPVSYAQPYIQLLENCLSVLQYMLIKNEKDTCESIKSSFKKKKNLRNLQSSCSADKPHCSLRIATCLLDDGVKEDTLTIIQAVTSHPMNQLSIHDYRKNVISQCFNLAIACFFNEKEKYIELIEQDLTIKDPYKTIEKLEQNREEDFDIIVYDVFSLAWKKSVFDVTFMVAELPILPKPVVWELCTCIHQSWRTVSFHPYLYGLFLEFLWYERYDSGNKEKESILKKMKKCSSIIPEKQQSRSLNLITYCCLLQNDFLSASRYLIQSFKLNPDKHNVAYLHIKLIINRLLNLSFEDLITYYNSLHKDFYSFSRYLIQSLTPHNVKHYVTYMFLNILNCAFLILELFWLLR